MRTGNSGEMASQDGCPHEGSCDDALKDWDTRCGYTGEALVVEPDGSPTFICNPAWDSFCYPLCNNLYRCQSREGYPETPSHEGQNYWRAETHSIQRLWRWECGNG